MKLNRIELLEETGKWGYGKFAEENLELENKINELLQDGGMHLLNIADKLEVSLEAVNAIITTASGYTTKDLWGGRFVSLKERARA